LTAPASPDPSGFGVFYGVFQGTAGAWCLVSLMQLVIGMAMANVALPCTRIYHPLERTTGFSFAYNCGYGVLGGLSPMVITAMKSGLSESMEIYAPALWLLILGSASLIGCALLTAYSPRLNKSFVGHIE